MVRRGLGRWLLRGPAARPLRPDESDSPAASGISGSVLLSGPPRGGRAAAAGCPGVGAAVAPRGRGAVGVGPSGRAAGVACSPSAALGSAAGPGSASARRRPCTGRGDRAIGRRSPRRVAPVVLGGRAVATPRRRSGGAAVRTTGPPRARGHRWRAQQIRRQAPTPLGPPFAGAAEPSPAPPPHLGPVGWRGRTVAATPSRGARAVRRRGREPSPGPRAPGPPLAGGAGPSPAPHAAGPPFAGAAEPSARTPSTGATVGGRSRTVAARPAGRARRSQAPPNRPPGPHPPGPPMAGGAEPSAAPGGQGRHSWGRAGRRRCSRCRRWEHCSARRRRPPSAGAGGAVRRCGPAVGACRGLGGSPRRPGAVDRWEGSAVRRLADGGELTAGRSPRPGKGPLAGVAPPTAGKDPLVGAAGIGRRRRGRATDGGERRRCQAPRPSTARVRRCRAARRLRPGRGRRSRRLRGIPRWRHPAPGSPAFSAARLRALRPVAVPSPCAASSSATVR